MLDDFSALDAATAAAAGSASSDGGSSSTSATPGGLSSSSSSSRSEHSAAAAAPLDELGAFLSEVSSLTSDGANTAAASATAAASVAGEVDPHARNTDDSILDGMPSDGEFEFHHFIIFRVIV